MQCLDCSCLWVHCTREGRKELCESPWHFTPPKSLRCKVKTFVPQLGRGFSKPEWVKSIFVQKLSSLLSLGRSLGQCCTWLLEMFVPIISLCSLGHCCIYTFCLLQCALIKLALSLTYSFGSEERDNAFVITLSALIRLDGLDWPLLAIPPTPPAHWLRSLT